MNAGTKLNRGDGSVTSANCANLIVFGSSQRTPQPIFLLKTNFFYDFTL